MNLLYGFSSRMPKKRNKNYLEVFEATVHKLRQECPWDQKQTHQSLIKYLIEECYEAVEALESKDPEKIKEELGDVLLQIFLHSEIASEKKTFDINEVAKTVDTKMKVRHPHIYGGLKYKGLKKHLARWSEVKASENPDKGLLEGTPKSMPALILAQRYGEIAASVGFDWPDVQGVLEKIQEEALELKEAAKSKKKQDIEMEFGDLLFTLTRLGAYLKIDSETALKKSSAKFYKRFSGVEKSVKKSKRKWKEFTLEELEIFWKQQK